MTIYLSNGQSGEFFGGTCNVTFYDPYAYPEESEVSCSITTCFEYPNDTEDCNSIERILTCRDLQQSGCEISPYTLTVFCYQSSVFQVQCIDSQQQQTCLDPSVSYDLVPNRVWIGVSLVLFFLPIIIFFNCNLASGPNHSCVFFYQCAPLTSQFGMYVGSLVMQNFFIFDNLKQIMLEYCKYIIVLFVIVLIPFLVKCTWCPLQKCRLPWAKVRRAVRNFREKHIGSTFIHAICSIIVLSYGDLVAISMRVVIVSSEVIASGPCCFNAYRSGSTPAPCNEPYATTFRNMYLQYLIPSVIILALLLPLPLSLIYYPSIPALFHKLTGRFLPRFPKLDPVFDVFQGVYKDKMRWFAGVHLLYLMNLWAVYIVLPDVIPFFFVLILAIHSLFQPFKNAKHNYLETLYLVYLVIMSLGNNYAQNIYADSYFVINDKDMIYHRVVLFISLILLAFPGFLVFIFCCYKILSKRVCCQRCVSSLKNCCSREDDEQEHLIQEQHVQEEDPPLHEVEWST